MASCSGSSSNVTITMDCNESGSSQSGNYSTFAWDIWGRDSAGLSFNSSSPASWSVAVDGQGASGSYLWSPKGTQNRTMGSGSFNSGHNSNGTARTIGFSFSFGGIPSTSIGGCSGSGSVGQGENFPPITPTGIGVTSTTATTATVHWSAGSGGPAVGNYLVQWSTNQSSWSQSGALGGSPYTVTGLTRATLYYFRVIAQNASGNSGWDGNATGTTKTTVPGAPTSLTSNGSGSPTTWPLTWTAPADNGGQAITDYQVQWALASDFSGTVTQQDMGSGTSNTLTGLPPGTTIYARVFATNATGPGASSTVYSFTTLPSTPPTLAVTPGASGKSVTVTLSPPSGVSSVTSYTVYAQDQTTHATTSTSIPSTTGTVGGLTPGHEYLWYATATIGTYVSPQSTPSIDLVQPQPSTAAGAFFDGDTTDTSDENYAWIGTAGASTSTATGVGVAGWKSTTPAGTGAAAFTRITGGRTGSYCGQITVTEDLASSPGSNGSLAVEMDPSHVDYLAPIQADTSYDFSLYLTASRATMVKLRASWYGYGAGDSGDSGSAAPGSLLGSSDSAPLLVSASGDWQRLDAVLKSPDGAEWAQLLLFDYDDGSGSWHQLLSGDQMLIDDVMIILASPQSYFDGSFPADANYSYSWEGAANASVSVATPEVQASIDPLADPDLPDVPLPPQPPQIEDEGIIDVGTWRRYWIQIPYYQIPAWLNAVPTLILNSGSDDVRQVRIRYYSNPDDLAPQDFDASSWEAEQIVSYLPATTTLMIDGVGQRTWAQVNGAASIPADQLLYGTGGIPATWPVLSCGTGWLISFDTPLDSPAGALTLDVQLTGMAV